MANLDTYKIEVVQGINDIAIPPNFNGNGRGPNGGYFTKKYNDLIYALGFKAPVITDFFITVQGRNPSPIDSLDLEVGIRLLDTPANLSLTYTMDNPGNLSYMDIYLNNIKQNTNPLLPGEPHLYPIEDISGAINQPKNVFTMNWVLLGEDQLGDPVGPYEFNISWKFRTYIGYSTRADIESYTDANFNIDIEQSVLYKPLTVTKPASQTPEYLYIFLPAGKETDTTGYDEYEGHTINGFEAPFSLDTKYVTRFGVTVRYYVYRLANPTAGSITVNLS